MTGKVIDILPRLANDDELALAVISNASFQAFKDWLDKQEAQGNKIPENTAWRDVYFDAFSTGFLAGLDFMVEK